MTLRAAPLRVVTYVAFGALGGWLGFMAQDRFNPVRYYTTEVLNSPHIGDSLHVKHNVWRAHSCYTTVYRVVFDRSGNRLLVPDLTFPAGVLPLGDDTFITSIPILPEAVSGDAIYRVVRKYRCNVLHWIWPVEDGPHDIPFKIAVP